MNFTGDHALSEFEDALNAHTDHVRAAFDRVFAGANTKEIPTPRSSVIEDTIEDRAAEVAKTAVKVFRLKTEPQENDQGSDRIAELLERVLATSTNSARAISFLTRINAAFEKDSDAKPIKTEQLANLIRLSSASEFFGEMIANRPSLIHSLPFGERLPVRRHYESELSNAVTSQTSFADELTTLRLKWSELLIEIGAHDAAGTEGPSQTNQLLTELAKGATNAALLSAERELERRYGALAVDPRIAILGLGRFGSGGMDYGSDLDVVVVYDAASGSPVNGLTQEECYARLTEYFVAALSSITREGVLYRVDLRLRPDGQKGPLATSSSTFINYLATRAAIWEWLAYVKLRAVAGDLEFAQEVETSARGRIHQLARQTDARQLAAETRRVRDRLQKAKAPRRHGGVNIKHGAGGMLDVYFAVRYLQLRDNVPDDGEDRTTRRMLQRLLEVGSIGAEDFQRMSTGYRLLRLVDHQLRLILGRSATVPAYEATAFIEIAARLGYLNADDLRDDLISGIKDIRLAYDNIVAVE
jgi:glutamate-ammonia-ligase adenylyltransferase